MSRLHYFQAQSLTDHVLNKPYLLVLRFEQHPDLCFPLKISESKIKRRSNTLSSVPQVFLDPHAPDAESTIVLSQGNEAMLSLAPSDAKPGFLYHVETFGGGRAKQRYILIQRNAFYGIRAPYPMKIRDVCLKTQGGKAGGAINQLPNYPEAENETPEPTTYSHSHSHSHPHELVADDFFPSPSWNEVKAFDNAFHFQLPENPGFNLDHGFMPPSMKSEPELATATAATASTHEDPYAAFQAISQRFLRQQQQSTTEQKMLEVELPPPLTGMVSHVSGDSHSSLSPSSCPSPARDTVSTPPSGASYASSLSHHSFGDAPLYSHDDMFAPQQPPMPLPLPTFFPSHEESMPQFPPSSSSSSSSMGLIGMMDSNHHLLHQPTVTGVHPRDPSPVPSAGSSSRKRSRTLKTWSMTPRRWHVHRVVKTPFRSAITSPEKLDEHKVQIRFGGEVLAASSLDVFGKTCVVHIPPWQGPGPFPSSAGGGAVEVDVEVLVDDVCKWRTTFTYSFDSKNASPSSSSTDSDETDDGDSDSDPSDGNGDDGNGDGTASKRPKQGGGSVRLYASFDCLSSFKGVFSCPQLQSGFCDMIQEYLQGKFAVDLPGQSSQQQAAGGVLSEQDQARNAMTANQMFLFALKKDQIKMFTKKALKDIVLHRVLQGRVDQLDQHGFGVIHYVSASGYSDLLGYLIAHGANVNLYGEEAGYTALDLAKQREVTVRATVSQHQLYPSKAQTTKQLKQVVQAVEAELQETEHVLHLLRQAGACERVFVPPHARGFLQQLMQLRVKVLKRQDEGVATVPSTVPAVTKQADLLKLKPEELWPWLLSQVQQVVQSQDDDFQKFQAQHQQVPILQSQQQQQPYVSDRQMFSQQLQQQQPQQLAFAQMPSSEQQQQRFQSHYGDPPRNKEIIQQNQKDVRRMLLAPQEQEQQQQSLSQVSSQMSQVSQVSSPQQKDPQELKQSSVPVQVYVTHSSQTSSNYTKALSQTVFQRQMFQQAVRDPEWRLVLRFVQALPPKVTPLAVLASTAAVPASVISSATSRAVSSRDPFDESSASELKQQQQQQQHSLLKSSPINEDPTTVYQDVDAMDLEGAEASSSDSAVPSASVLGGVANQTQLPEQEQETEYARPSAPAPAANKAAFAQRVFQFLKFILASYFAQPRLEQQQQQQQVTPRPGASFSPATLASFATRVFFRRRARDPNRTMTDARKEEETKMKQQPPHHQQLPQAAAQCEEVKVKQEDQDEMMTESGPSGVVEEFDSHLVAHLASIRVSSPFPQQQQQHRRQLVSQSAESTPRVSSSSTSSTAFFFCETPTQERERLSDGKVSQVSAFSLAHYPATPAHVLVSQQPDDRVQCTPLSPNPNVTRSFGRSTMEPPATTTPTTMMTMREDDKSSFVLSFSASSSSSNPSADVHSSRGMDVRTADDSTPPSLEHSVPTTLQVSAPVGSSLSSVLQSSMSIPAPLFISQRRALCVGINEYAEVVPLPSLSGCVNDATKLAHLLSAKHQFCDVRTLINAQATRASILEQVQQLGSASRAGDLLVVYFAGHGTQHSLIVRDGASIGVVELNQLFNSFLQVKATLLVDACSDEFTDVPHVPSSSSSSSSSSSPARNPELRKRGFVTANFPVNPQQIVSAAAAAADLPSSSSSSTSVVVESSNGSQMATVVSSLLTDDDVCRTIAIASAPAQAAFEKDFGEQSHGLFTYFLLQELQRAAAVAVAAPRSSSSAEPSSVVSFMDDDSQRQLVANATLSSVGIPSSAQTSVDGVCTLVGRPLQDMRVFWSVLDRVKSQVENASSGVQVPNILKRATANSLGVCDVAIADDVSIATAALARAGAEAAVMTNVTAIDGACLPFDEDKVVNLHNDGGVVVDEVSAESEVECVFPRIGGVECVLRGDERRVGYGGAGASDDVVGQLSDSAVWAKKSSIRGAAGGSGPFVVTLAKLMLLIGMVALFASNGATLALSGAVSSSASFSSWPVVVVGGCGWIVITLAALTHLVLRPLAGLVRRRRWLVSSTSHGASSRGCCSSLETSPRPAGLGTSEAGKPTRSPQHAAVPARAFALKEKHQVQEQVQKQRQQPELDREESKRQLQQLNQAQVQEEVCQGREIRCPQMCPQASSSASALLTVQHPPQSIVGAAIATTAQEAEESCDSSSLGFGETMKGFSAVVPQQFCPQEEEDQSPLRSLRPQVLQQPQTQSQSSLEVNELYSPSSPALPQRFETTLQSSCASAALAQLASTRLLLASTTTATTAAASAQWLSSMSSSPAAAAVSAACSGASDVCSPGVHCQEEESPVPRYPDCHDDVVIVAAASRSLNLSVCLSTLLSSVWAMCAWSLLSASTSVSAATQQLRQLRSRLWLPLAVVAPGEAESICPSQAQEAVSSSSPCACPRSQAEAAQDTECQPRRLQLSGEVHQGLSTSAAGAVEPKLLLTGHREAMSQSSQSSLAIAPHSTAGADGASPAQAGSSVSPSFEERATLPLAAFAPPSSPSSPTASCGRVLPARLTTCHESNPAAVSIAVACRKQLMSDDASASSPPSSLSFSSPCSPSLHCLGSFFDASKKIGGQALFDGRCSGDDKSAVALARDELTRVVRSGDTILLDDYAYACWSQQSVSLSDCCSAAA